MHGSTPFIRHISRLPRIALTAELENTTSLEHYKDRACGPHHPLLWHEAYVQPPELAHELDRGKLLGVCPSCC